jgi:hypothetical protein
MTRSPFLDFADPLNFLQDMTFRKLTVLQSSGKEALNLVNRSDQGIPSY